MAMQLPTPAACRSQEALRLLRNTRRDFASVDCRDSESSEDARLLPTAECLRAAFPVATVRNLLSCVCRICEQTKPTGWGASDLTSLESALDRQASGDSLRRSLAVFVLAGCAFAFRLFRLEDIGEGQDHPVNQFLNHLVRDGSGRKRELLFGPFISGPWTSRALEDLAQAFAARIRAKFWLVELPYFSIRETEFDCGRKNLPFTIMRRVGPEPGGPPHKDLFEIEIDHGHCDQELRKKLFLKRLKVSKDDYNTAAHIQCTLSEYRQEVSSQLEIQKRLESIPRKEDPCIVKLLFSFQAEDDSSRHISMVFEFYNFTLQEVIEKTRNSELPPLLQWTGLLGEQKEVHPPQHPLWKSALKLARTLVEMHDVPTNDIDHQPSSKLLCAHLDIKPLNIVVDGNRMLLIDFEHAYVGVRGHGQSSSFHATPGTLHYQPPETNLETQHEYTHTEISRVVDPSLRRNYDVWSLGCVLLEVLVSVSYLLRNNDPCGATERETVIQFRQKRRNDAVNNENEAFWRRDEQGVLSLRPSVQAQIDKLKRFGGHSEHIAKQIEKMLDTNQATRPPMRDCVSELTVPLDLQVFLPPGYNQVMSHQIPSMKTMFDTMNSNVPEPYGCSISLCRPPSLTASSNFVFLGILADDGRNKAYVPGYGNEDVVNFSPRFLYPSTSRLPAGTSASCSFTGLHDGVTLYFENSNDFRLFQVALTTQLYRPLPEGEVYGLHFNTARLHKRLQDRFRNLLPDSQCTLRGGHVQLLYRCDKTAYENIAKDGLKSGFATATDTASRARQARPRIKRGALGSAHQSTNSSSLENRSRYRLVLYGVAHNEERICYMFEVDHEDCSLHISEAKSHTIIFEGPLRVTVFTKSTDISSPFEPSDYPGWPISPTKLDRITSEEGSGPGWKTLKIDRIELEMHPRGAMHLLHRTLKHYGWMQ